VKAAVLHQVGQPLVVENVPDPTPAAHEVVVATRSCGICRTDLHIQDGLAYVPSLPHIPGHEPAGVVAAVGKDVNTIRVGQRVVPHLFIADRECSYTLRGQHAQATHLHGILGVTLPGGFAEYFKAHARNLLAVPDGLPFDVAGLTSCAVVTAVHAFRKTSLGPGHVAIVLGAGGIGLVLVQLLVTSGVRTVAIDRSSAALRAADELGAALTVDANDPDAEERVLAWSGSSERGADAVFELVGRADTMNLAARLVARDGPIVVIGEEAEFPAIDTITLAQRELRVLGSRNGGMQDARDALDLMARGVLHPPIARRYPLDEINEAIEFVRKGKVPGRVVLTVTSPLPQRKPGSEA
jgi:propanol-preferring alcohol dehydrogenase